jgi:transketolase
MAVPTAKEALMSGVSTTSLDLEHKKNLEGIAAAIRSLSIDAVQAANSGHPGLPLGCAEIGAYLYGHELQHNPKSSGWLNRDRFVLSAGHGSAWLYSCLHLSGFDLSLDELKRFRQRHSKTPGHPEALETDGVETTTGPLGQGVATAAGQALGLKMLAARFPEVFSAKVFCLCGDGCIMEGISSEASSLAGHLALDNFVLIYDANNITLDGPLDESCSEDTAARYRAYGWEVYEVDGHDLNAIHSLFTHLRSKQTRPALVIAKTVIGKGSPNKAGTHKVHGAPLGEEEVLATKKALGLPEEPFAVAEGVRKFFSEKLTKDAAKEEEWNRTFASWKEAAPDQWQTLSAMLNKEAPKDLEAELRALSIEAPVAGRKASNAVIQKLAAVSPRLIGGSADLSCSDSTMIKDGGIVAPGDFSGKNIKYGVREFAMAAMASGLSQTDCFLPFVGTFFTFSDYMRNAIRLAALMEQQVVYQFTHDSVLLGEDGPTHQPVEHLASLRAMPNLHVWRPGDENETKMAWLSAVRYQGPTAIVLSRQNIPSVKGSDLSFAEGAGRGAYILRREKGDAADFTLMATGSELALAIEVADALEKKGKKVRIVSMPCWELFEQQDAAYRREVLCGELGTRVSIEAAVSFGWDRYVGRGGVMIAIDGFGASAPQKDIAEEYGFTVEKILERIEK